MVQMKTCVSEMLGNQLTLGVDKTLSLRTAFIFKFVVDPLAVLAAFKNLGRARKAQRVWVFGWENIAALPLKLLLGHVVIDII